MLIDDMASTASEKDEAPEPCVLIGYPSRKDGPILPTGNFPNKSFIEQACSLKMTGYWPLSFLHLGFYRPQWSIVKRKNNLPANIQPY